MAAVFTTLEHDFMMWSGGTFFSFNDAVISSELWLSNLIF